MAETLYATSHLAGTCTTPNNALGVADGTWTENIDSDDWTSRWAMDDPSSSLDTGTQTIEVAGRKSTAGAGGDPAWVITLYENGSSVGVIGSGSLTTDTGTLTGTFNGSAITDETLVEIQIAATANGGGPNECTLQVDSITWTATITALVDEIMPAMTSATASCVMTGRVFV